MPPSVKATCRAKSRTMRLRDFRCVCGELHHSTRRKRRSPTPGPALPHPLSLLPQTRKAPRRRRLLAQIRGSPIFSVTHQAASGRNFRPLSTRWPRLSPSWDLRIDGWRRRHSVLCLQVRPRVRGPSPKGSGRVRSDRTRRRPEEEREARCGEHLAGQDQSFAGIARAGRGARQRRHRGAVWA